MPTIKDIAPESVFTIELNAGTPGIQGPQGPQGVQGPVGPEGKIGPKPIRGIDYFTQQDINNMVSTVTSSSNSAFNENVANRTAEFNSNVSIKTTAFDNNALLKTEDFNTNAKTKKTDFNLNANNKTTEFNTNASNKKNEIDTHVTNKTTEFDNHVVEKINEFKEETSEYVTETELNSKGYLVQNDLNGYAKEEDLFSGSYNDLKDKPKIPSKTSELTNDIGFINTIPSEYVTEEEQNEFIKPYNERIEQNEKYILDMETYLDTITPKQTASGELVHINDALPLPTFENKVDGNVKQFTTTGKNLLNVPSTYSVTGYNERTINIPSGTYVFSATKRTSTNSNTTSLFYFYEGQTPVGQIYIGGTQPLSKTLNLTGNANRILIYSAGSYAESVDVTTTFENLMISKDGGTYEPFTNGASPNPEFPSEIEVLEGYNLANIKVIPNRATPDLVVANNTITISNNAHTEGYTHTYVKLSELCPNLKVGDLVTLSFQTTYTRYNTPFIYLEGINIIWYTNSIKTITQEMLDSIVILYGGYNETTTISEFMITKGSTKKPYLSYGCVGYQVMEDNYFDISKVKNNVNGYVINNNDGTLTINTSEDSSGVTADKPNTLKDYCPNLKVGETYYLNATTTSSKAFILLLEYGGFWSFSTSKTITQEMLDSQVFWYLDKVLETGTISNIIISKENKPYEPYKEQIVPLDLKGNWIGKINDNIKDYIVTDKKKYWLVKNVNRRLISITNNPFETDTEKWFFFNKPTDSIDYEKYTTNGFSEVCVPNKNNPIYFSGAGNRYFYSVNYNKSKIETIPTLEEVKTLADGKYFYYQLAKPQIIELGKLPEPIKTFEGINNIQLLANLDTEIEVLYGLDVKKYYDNKLAEISAQII